jgi:hypothetical protein
MKPVLAISLCLLGIGVGRADLWEPWRKDAKEDLNSASYTISKSEPVLFKPWAHAAGAAGQGVTPQTGSSPEDPALYATYDATNKASKISISLGDIPITKAVGCELRFWFRVAQVPAKMEASHTLALFELAGPGRKDRFYLHVYRPPKAGSTKTGFMLNQLAKKGQWERVAVARGAVLPAAATPLDRAWHTVRIAWRVGEMEVFFDNLLTLRVFDPAIDYQTFSILKVRPGGDDLFKSLDLSAIEARPITFHNN